MVTIGLVRCGTIGSRLAIEIQRRFQGTARLIGLYDRNDDAAKQLQKKLKPHVPILSPDQLIQRCQLLIEAASANAVGQLLPKAIKHRKGLLLMSTGGLLQHPDLLRKAIARKIPLYLPSGAIAGLDGIKAAGIGRLKSVTLTTRKHPKSLSGAPGIAQAKLQLNSLRSPRTVFKGSAAKAVSAFPQNINVAATLALAGMGAARTQVRIVADPTVHTNTHEIEAVGDFGTLFVRTENRPARENPKTSQLAVFSAIATLKQILEPIRVGT